MRRAVDCHSKTRQTAARQTDTRQTGKTRQTVARQTGIASQWDAPNWSASNSHASKRTRQTGMPPMGYQHLTVNHQIQFANPLNGACTNHVECYWKNAKLRNKTECGTARTQLESYLIEYMWRTQFGGNPLQSFIEHVRVLYPTHWSTCFVQASSSAAILLSDGVVCDVTYEQWLPEQYNVFTH